MTNQAPSITVETFAKFRQGMKTQSRDDHMRLCGFHYAGTISAENGKPNYLARRKALAFCERTGLSVHCVYFQGGSNMNGMRGYSVFLKGVY